MRKVHRSEEKGMAALVVTVILISLLSAIAVAFSLIMSRESQKALNNQLSQSAYNAAASGINDAISYLHDNPNTNVTQCQDLLGASKPLSLAADLSGNGSTKYTCVLINNTPHNIIYQNIPAGSSQIVKTSFASPVSKLMFSWQSTNRGYNNFVPVAESGQLKDETTWKTGKYTPMLKVSLYPVFADTQDATFATANTKTFYLYPLKSSGFSVNTMSYATTSGTLQSVECGLKNNNGQFNGTGSYDCNLILNNLPTANPAGYIYYVRITPLYGAADVEIRANDTTASSTEVSFVSTQAVIDVTAQSSNVLKRLQARIDISSLNGASQDISASDNTFPEFALRSSNTVCKRLQNPSSPDFPAFIDKATIGYCGVDLSVMPPLDPPIIDPFGCSSTGQNSGTCSGTINPNNGQITYCHFSSSAGDGPNCALSPKPTAPSYTTSPYVVSWNLGSLSPGTGYTVTLCADNPASPPSHTCKTASFTTDLPPAPAPSPAPVLTNFSQPSDATCTARYGSAHANNCFDYAGSNLANGCTAHLFNTTVNVNSGGNGGSFTFGDGPTATGYIECSNSGGYASCNLGQSCPPPSPTPLPSVTITFLDISGVYNNPIVYRPYCPDDFHSYVDCVRWASISSNAGTVSCVASYTNFGGTTNSGSKPAGSGWTVGSNDTSWLLFGSAKVTCTGSLGGTDTKSVSGPPSPGCYPAGDASCIYGPNQ